ncbi:unnamed protein product [Dicrocoelium dendriticum]|nr:unnamed protein product [Dicrocoelium dendriticum]
MSQCVDGEAAAHMRVRYDFEGERVQLHANAALIIIQGNIPVRKGTTARVYQLWGRCETSSQFTYGNPEIGLQLYKADDLCAVCMTIDYDSRPIIFPLIAFWVVNFQPQHWWLFRSNLRFHFPDGLKEF